MKIIKNKGHFPSVDEKQLRIPSINFQSSTDLEISECHFPKEVELDNSSFSGIENVYIENGTAILKTPDSHLFVNSKDAVGRSIIDKTTIIASNGARAIVSEGGTAIAIDNKSTLVRAGYHPDNRLEAKVAGTLIVDITDNGDKSSYITTKIMYAPVIKISRMGSTKTGNAVLLKGAARLTGYWNFQRGFRTNHRVKYDPTDRRVYQA